MCLTSRNWTQYWPSVRPERKSCLLIKLRCIHASSGVDDNSSPSIACSVSAPYLLTSTGGGLPIHRELGSNQPASTTDLLAIFAPRADKAIKPTETPFWPQLDRGFIHTFPATSRLEATPTPARKSPAAGDKTAS